LREALKVLAYEGLVVLHHNRGAAVSPLTREDLEQTFPIFARLEGLAGELACANLSPDEMAEIRRQHEEMLAHYRDGDYQSHFAANERIHAAIQHGSKNRNLIQLLQRLSSRVARARAQLTPNPEQWARAVAEHEAIMAALEARDGELTAMLLRQHIENIFGAIAEAFVPWAGPAGGDDAVEPGGEGQPQ
jgi:DNA-binding GntR family transcriptional regulator